MTDYEFGDVILVPFPFTDQTAAKKHPAVVVSSTSYNRHRPDIVLMAITSQTHSARSEDVPVAEWQQAGRLKPSLMKPIFTTVEKGLVLRKLGILGKKDREALLQALQFILGE